MHANVFFWRIPFLYFIPIYTPCVNKKRATLFFYYNFRVLWSIFNIFSPLETEMNTLQKSYKMYAYLLINYASILLVKRKQHKKSWPFPAMCSIKSTVCKFQIFHSTNDLSSRWRWNSICFRLTISQIRWIDLHDLNVCFKNLLFYLLENCISSVLAENLSHSHRFSTKFHLQT